MAGMLAGGASAALARPSGPSYPSAQQVVSWFQPATDKITVAEILVVTNPQIPVAYQEVIVDRLSAGQSVVDDTTFDILGRLGLL